MNNSGLAQNLLEEVGFSLLDEGRTLRVRADGYSMYPAIKPGSVIYIEPVTEGSSPVKGEIIAWKKDSGFTVHRLVRIIGEENYRFIVTRGDSHLTDDDPEPFDRIAGRVIKVEYPEGITVHERKYLGKTPKYKLNRLLVRIILQISRIKRKFRLLTGGTS